MGGAECPPRWPLGQCLRVLEVSRQVIDRGASVGHLGQHVGHVTRGDRTHTVVLEACVTDHLFQSHNRNVEVVVGLSVHVCPLGVVSGARLAPMTKASPNWQYINAYKGPQYPPPPRWATRMPPRTKQ